MLIKEAQWIKSQIHYHFNDDDFPLLNLGSSTIHFRKFKQSHIHNEIFYPLEINGRKVIHCDIKDMKGVDIVGNITNDKFRSKLKKMKIKSVLCSNLLEHVINPNDIINCIDEILPKNGKLIVTTPYYFPFHKDPIDTMFRPSVNELKLFFKNYSLLSSDLIKSDQSILKVFISNPKYFLIILLRWMLPFYKYNEWKFIIKDLFNLNTKFSASCILINKIK